MTQKPKCEMLNIASLIKEIGRGPHGARGLSRADATTLASALFAGDIPPGQLGAILIALRMKGETLDEVGGFHAAALSHCAMLTAPADGPLAVVIPSYNGARRNPNLVPLLALLLRSLGVTVLIHGLTEVPGRTTTAQIFIELELPICTSTQAAEMQLSTTRLAFVPLQVLSPALADLLAWRDILGVRNVGHTVVKLINPLGARGLSLVAMTHPPYLALLREYYAACEDSVLLFRGAEGEPIASPTRVPDIDWFEHGHHQVLSGIELTVNGDRTRSALDAVTTAQFIRAALRSPALIPHTLLEHLARILVAAHAAPTQDDARTQIQAHIAQGLAA